MSKAKLIRIWLKGKCSRDSHCGMDQAFKADDYKCFELFGGEKALYEIPAYQRPYSWQKKHVIQLLEDLTTAFNESGFSEENSQDAIRTDSSYYLGSIILVGDDGRRDTRFEILDGQQRITTLTLLYAVLDHYFGVKPSKRRDDVSVRLKDHTRDQWRLETRENADFRQTVLETLDLDADNRYATTASHIVEFFESEFDGERNDLESFLNYLDDEVHLVRIRTGNVQEAVRIFQTINTRGKDLTLTDKVKSYLLSYVPEENEDDFIEIWREIVNKLDGDYDQLDSILSWYRFYLTESEVNTGLYEDLVEELDESSPIKELRRIRDFVNEYLASQYDADKWLFMLENHGQSRYWQTILTAARLEKVSDISELKKCLVQLYYSYMIAGHYRTKTKVPSRGILKRIKSGKGVEGVKDYINDKREQHRIPSKVRDSLSSEDVFHENWHSNLLVAIEYQLSTDRKVEKISTGADLHIEHILPRVWKEESCGHTYWNDRFSEEQAEQLKHSIGNLIPLQYDLNQSVAQRPFPDKVEIYRGNGNYPKSSFDLVDAVADGRYDDWSPVEIRQHREFMIKQVAKLLDLPKEAILSNTGNSN